MLKNSIRKLRGFDLPGVPRTNVILPKGEGRIEAWPTSNKASKFAFTIPNTYIKDHIQRAKEEGAARLAESTANLVQLTNHWKEKYGPLPPSLQAKLKTLHLHACTRQLSIDLVGMIKSPTHPEIMDCVLRSPALRPRHWAIICSSSKQKQSPKGVNVIFPSRFFRKKRQTHQVQIIGGSRLNVQKLLDADGTTDKDDDEDWDALDEEEVEAMKQISSAMNVECIDEIDIETYPRLVIPALSQHPQNSRVDVILKTLLPIVRVIAQIQENNKDKAKVAAELREKREIIKLKRKEEEAQEKRRSGYYY